MQPDMAVKAPLARLKAALPQEWRRPLAFLVAAWAGLLCLFAGDWRDMALQWWDSSTYNHVLLIPPILCWLVSLRLPDLLRLTPSGWWPALFPFAGACFLWMLGDFAGFSLAKQLAVVVMLQASVLALLGPRVAAGLAFPLFYMLFLVPAGDEMIPALQTITARLTMAMLAFAGGPATIDGVFITTRSGYFEVAEACSGVKFLIAMIAYGALVANVCFRSWPRRVAFMALSITVPILANGARAWGTIFIAGKVGIQFAASFDHVFYGWVFFAIVMALTMAAGWKFFDRAIDDPMIDAEAINRSPAFARLAAMTIGQGRALAALAGLVLAFLAWGGSANRLQAPMPSQIALPEVVGWHHVALPANGDWHPLHTGADHRLLGRYANAEGQVVDVSYALYASQADGKEAGGFGQGAQPLGGFWAWEKPGPAIAGARADVIQAPGPIHRLALTWYRTGELLTGSNARLKIANIGDRLLLRKRSTATLIVSSEGPTGVSEAAVRAFLAATGPVGQWMDRTGAVR